MMWRMSCRLPGGFGERHEDGAEGHGIGLIVRGGGEDRFDFVCGAFGVPLGFDEADEGGGGFGADPGFGEICGELGDFGADFDFAEAVGEGDCFLGEGHAAVFEQADVAGEAFDFGEVVGGDEDGRFVGVGKEGFGEFVADEGVEPGEGFVEDDEFGAGGEGADEGGLHAHAAGEVFQFAVEREAEDVEEFAFAGGVPGGIERAPEGEEFGDGHCVGHLLVFRDVADAGVLFGAEFAGVDTQNGGGAGVAAEEVHEDLERGGFAGAVGADEGVDAALRDFEIESV